ncbi:unnamed protein product [Clonostachys rosea]|uniref:Uncharacterized protein n=1 Tax=Bionectria ochroleuca TaxID=29856 RepID=A0ABY6UA19_BIOOC|nr:unnamed protein product [Clonostachys rosea]
MFTRRDIASTDESAYSVTASLIQATRVAEQYFAADIEREPAISVLNKTLSITTTISTTSSFARLYQQASSRPDLQHLIQIGEGLQGAIFEQVGKTLVIKKESPENETRASRLDKEYKSHTHISLAFQTFEPLVESGVFVPRPATMIPSTDLSFWNENLGKFPPDYQIPTTVVKMERILPIPKVGRKALIAHFYPWAQSSIDEEVVQKILSAQPNKHCLVRIYLGRKTCEFDSDNFSLRNFPLCLDAMKNIGVKVEALARSMGKAYAIVHWGACYNGDDVEFVFGTLLSEAHLEQTFQSRAVRLCLLDFGQCELVNMERDAEMVYMSFHGAMVLGDNQWFIPHCHRDPDLFNHFRAGYIDAGNIILHQKGWASKFNMNDFMTGYEEYTEDFLV